MHKQYRKINYIFIIYVLIITQILICFLLPTEVSAFNDNKNYYSINIGSKNAPKDLKNILKEWQKKLNNRPIYTEVEVNYFNYRFEQDHLLLKQLLESEGYYQSEIKASFNEEKHQADFTVIVEDPYLFDKIEISINGYLIDAIERLEINIPEVKSLNAQLNHKAIISKVRSDERYIEKWIEKNNCLFTYNISHKAIINHLTHRVNITYFIEYTNKATYGDIIFSGAKTIDEGYLISLLPIKKGECFKRSSLNNAKLSLRKSRLIDKIEIVLPEVPSSDGSVPIKFIVTENPHRTVKFGANYSTDIGAGISTGWEHRNVLSHGEKISTNLLIAEIEKKLDIELEKPFFIRHDQKLKIAGSIKKEDNEAYQSNGVEVSGAIERDYANQWIAGIGTKYEFERIIDQDNDEKTMLLSLPIFASQNKRDNLLDPQEGWSLNFSAAPAFDTIDVSTSFIKNQFSGTYYTPISETGKSVLAIRTSFGSITGASSNTIPATERFYGGGSGSIRGYGYQMVSPLDKENKPLGGRSLLELSTELRFRISDNYGVVPFLDCGSSFTSKFPNSGDKMLCGTGIGLRYYTTFGPIRMDFAVPLDKRAGIDNSFQLYFSIGQSF
jgi:translocation and assembly module TamA